MNTTNTFGRTGSAAVDNVSLLVSMFNLAKSAAATIASAFQPRAETAAESTERLRILADEYEATQPSFAADLRAVISRTETREGV